MKKIVMALLGVVLVFGLASCGESPAAVSSGDNLQDLNNMWGETATPAPTQQTVTPAHETPAATEFAVPEDAVYRIEGARLTVDNGKEQMVIYDAAGEYPDGWTCGLDDLIVEDDGIYLTENGVSADAENGDEYIYRIVRLDRDGCHRMELVTQDYVGFLQVVVYGDKLVYVSDGFDSVMIGWVNRDGSGGDWVDFIDYATQQGVEPEYNNAELYFVGEDLFADIVFFDFDSENELADDTVWIKPDMTVEAAVD